MILETKDKRLKNPIDKVVCGDCGCNNAKVMVCTSDSHYENAVCIDKQGNPTHTCEWHELEPPVNVLFFGIYCPGCDEHFSDDARVYFKKDGRMFKVTEEEDGDAVLEFLYYSKDEIAPSVEATGEYTIEENANPHGFITICGPKGETICQISKSWWVPGLTSGDADCGTLEDRTKHHRQVAQKLVDMLTTQGEQDNGTESSKEG